MKPSTTAGVLYFFDLLPVKTVIQDFVAENWPEAVQSKVALGQCLEIAKHITRATLIEATGITRPRNHPDPKKLIDTVVDSFDVSFKRNNNTASDEISHRVEHIAAMEAIRLVVETCPHIDSPGTYIVKAELTSGSMLVCAIAESYTATYASTPHLLLPAPSAG